MRPGELFGLTAGLIVLGAIAWQSHCSSCRSSCYLVDSPRDELESIYERYGQIARLSKFAGGIGFAFHRVRSQGSLVRGANGLSNGIVP
jgi:ribonucleoside-diphosphate reductase alpha chain